MIAALYVEKYGIYREFRDIDMWPEDRDARNYNGPHSVLAHPPCQRWCGGLARVNQSRYGIKIGDDSGMFEHALACVRRFGGVLEHPAYSIAFDYFMLRRPVRGKWTYSSEDNSYVCEVSQSAYGHAARKRTWLYYIGKVPPIELRWNELKGRARISKGNGSDMSLPQLQTGESIHTPYPFAVDMVRLARMANGSGGI